MKSCNKCGKTFEDSVTVCPDDQTPLAATDGDQDPLIGTVLAGRYLIVERIGKGGMGTIYKAIHKMMDRPCAIKLLTAVTGVDESAIARFNLEARMASSIDNPHAVTIYDFGETEAGMLYLAMEFIDGEPLSRILERERSLAPERVARITTQIAAALSAAHSLGIVHRDLKPDNIMITSKSGNSDYVKVLDFGIAKLVTDRAENLTKTGFVLGTPLYMSPEQLCGEKLDFRSDIYSLAIIVYQMLAGRLPFEGENAQAIMMKRVTSDPIPLRVTSPQTAEYADQVVMWGLARDRDVRPATVDAFTSQLVEALSNSTGSSPGRATSPVVVQNTWIESDTVIEGPNAYQTRATKAATSQPPPVNTPQAPVPSAHVPEVSYDTVQSLREERDAPVASTPSYPTASQRTAAGKVFTEPRPEYRPFEKPAVKRGNRALGWGVALLVFLAVAAVAAYYFLVSNGHAGFTLIVDGSPAGSEVYVNNRLLGMVGPDGSFRYPGLQMETANIRVSRQGFTEFAGEVKGGDGVERRVTAKLLPLETDFDGAMVLVPAGEFVMGSDKFGGSEKPAHTVNVASFYIDKFEVTNAGYKTFCIATNRSVPENKFDAGYFSNNPDAPVVGISWEDAKAYAAWSGKRLPTEEEWEKAASWDAAEKKKRDWPWGSAADQSLANIGKRPPTFSPVGSFPRDKSAYGIFDMAGNAGEWVESVYLAYPGNQTADSGFGNKNRVVRGGSPVSNLDQARTTFRFGLPAQMPPQELSKVLVGFRCAVSADDPKLLNRLAGGNR